MFNILTNRTGVERDVLIWNAVANADSCSEAVSVGPRYFGNFLDAQDHPLLGRSSYIFTKYLNSRFGEDYWTELYE